MRERTGINYKMQNSQFVKYITHEINPLYGMCMNRYLNCSRMKIESPKSEITFQQVCLLMLSCARALQELTRGSLFVHIYLITIESNRSILRNDKV